jgi:hypothetical protein
VPAPSLDSLAKRLEDLQDVVRDLVTANGSQTVAVTAIVRHILAELEAVRTQLTSPDQA